jgi:hypothetical protein
MGLFDIFNGMQDGPRGGRSVGGGVLFICNRLVAARAP